MKFRTLALTFAIAAAAAGSAFAATTEITKEMPNGTVKHIVRTDNGLHNGQFRHSEFRNGQFRHVDLRPGHRIVKRTVIYRDGMRRDRDYGVMHHHRMHHVRRTVTVIRPS